MLRHLHLEHFKSFVDQSIDLAPFTLLVGANAAGKSNLLDAVRFLQGLGLGLRAIDILQGYRAGGQQIWSGIRGGVEDAATRGEKTFSMISRWDVADECFTYTINFETEPNPGFGDESLSSVHGTGFRFDSRSNEFDISRDPDAASADQKQAPTGLVDLGVRMPATIRRVTGSALGIAGMLFGPTEAQRIDTLCDAMSAAMFLDITPARMRHYVPQHMDVLGSEGENLSAMVWQACQDPDQKLDLVDWLTELCAPELTDIDFVKTELGDVMLLFVEADGRRISARSLSDGTLRFLGLLMALRTAPAGSLLLIEDIESGLHPTRVHLLVEAIESATRTRGIQVIASTHSPQVLQALAPDALAAAVVMGRVPEQPGTIMRRLGDLPHFEEIRARRGIEHLFTTGWLERAL